MPTGLHNKELPRYFKTDTEIGRRVFTATVQHSVCVAMMRTVFVPFGPHGNNQMWDVAEALYGIDPDHEAIWRLMTVNTILHSDGMMSTMRAKLRGEAEKVLSTWSPLPPESHRAETVDRLTQLLVNCATTWLNLMRLRDRIKASIDVSSHYFDSDSEDSSQNVPGDFNLPDTTHPVLYLFPVFFGNHTPDEKARPDVIRNGQAVFRDSPTLLLALQAESEAMKSQSPTTSVANYQGQARAKS